MKNKTSKSLPKFSSNDEEMKFWDTHDMTEYMDEIPYAISFPNLKPSTETISLRLPLSLLDTIKIEANKRDIPYQSYIKMKLAEAFGFK